jgi:hypothetical protein
MTKMFSVTCPNDMGVFIEEKELSPSSIFQTAVQQIMDSCKISEEFVKELQRRIEGLSSTLNKQREFIEEKGLMDDFLGLKLN